MIVRYDLAKYGNDQKILCQNGVLKNKNSKSVSYILYNILWKKKHLGDKLSSMLKIYSKIKEETWSEVGKSIFCDHHGISTFF